MKTEKKYEQWKAITESDFVTLFIKTWFTYIASLRELTDNERLFGRRINGFKRKNVKSIYRLKQTVSRIQTDE